MLRNKIYYGLKPFIPRPVRMAMRSRVAARIRARTIDDWPILAGSEVPPAGWPGWPEGKQFAFVLTHDIEGPQGLENCRALMHLEMELGLRSAFNFVPEGTYAVPNELRDELVANGFEVGVHDYRHNGRLFSSRRDFARSAAEINRYLKLWNATGFRAGFMLHNLDWLHQLDIAYDASTFDVDPFEPQPEGRQTIFPLWIPRPHANGDRSANDRQGYVELPYTLPQDSTLFFLLDEAGPDIWVRKLNWIARHHGMALINSHPDYMGFDNRSKPRRVYPVRYYREFLQYVCARHAGKFWHALPRQVSSYVRSIDPAPVLRRRRRVCMISYSHYNSDNRVMRYAQALAERGDHVDVFALRASPDLPKTETVDGVHLFRIQDRFSKTERSPFQFLWPLLQFFCTATVRVTWGHLKNRYDIFHIHNVPDFLVFTAFYPKLTGARVILDVHDIVPEFFSSKFGTEARGLTFNLLSKMERASAGFADHVIIANHLWREKYAARTGTAGRCTPFINNVDSKIFAPQPRKRSDDKQIILFPGGLQWHQGVDVALRAFGRIRSELPNAEFHIYGDGSAKGSLRALSQELGLNGSVQFFDTRSVREIAKIMAEADLGVVPKRADSFGNEAYSTKIMEFMSVGVPVVVSDTKVDRFYFDDSVVRFVESGNDAALAQAMLDLLRSREKRQTMIAKGLQYAERNNWQNCKGDYLRLVDSVCTGDDVNDGQVFRDRKGNKPEPVGNSV